MELVNMKPNKIVIKNHVRLINSAISEGWWNDLLKQGVKNFPSIRASAEKLLCNHNKNPFHTLTS